jgi:hypothetical protein
VSERRCLIFGGAGTRGEMKGERGRVSEKAEVSAEGQTRNKRPIIRSGRQDVALLRRCGGSRSPGRHVVRFVVRFVVRLRSRCRGSSAGITTRPIRDGDWRAEGVGPPGAWVASPSRRICIPGALSPPPALIDAFEESEPPRSR